MKIKNKYSKTPVILAVLFDGHSGIDTPKIHDVLIKEGFPFSKVLLLNYTEQNTFIIGDIFPDNRQTEFEIKDLLPFYKKNKI